MQITVTIPEDLAQHPDPAREALEAFAIEGYRSGALTPYQTRSLLGFGTRHEFDGFLKEHEVWERAYTIEDLNDDADGFARDAHETEQRHTAIEATRSGPQSMVHEGHTY